MSNESSSKNLCFVHEDCIGDYNKAIVRTNVCKDLPATHEAHERYGSKSHFYCVLHLPSDNKVNNTDFHERVNSKVEKGLNNFTYIYVPDTATFFTKIFRKDTYFDNATFNGNAEFSGKLFEKSVFFRDVNFLEDAMFSGANFAGGADFSRAKFEKRAIFKDCKFTQESLFSETAFSGDSAFRGAEFCKVADFDHAIFSERPDFCNARFLNWCEFTSVTFPKGANFTGGVFLKQVNFTSSNFAGMTSFSSAEFENGLFFNFSRFESDSIVRFDQAKFLGSVSLQQTDIQGFVYFEGGERKSYLKGAEKSEGFTDCFQGDNALLILENARIEKSEKIYFHTVRLQPSWFINTDCRKFVFTACRWKMPTGKNLDVRLEIDALEKRNVRHPYKLLTKTCWQLADNYEENKSFPLASVFRQIANESNRLEEYRGFKVWSLKWWYWLSSYYGESWIRALGVLGIILIIFASIYMFVSFQICPMVKSTVETVCDCRPLNFGEALRHSFTTATFQNVEFRRPVTGWGEAFTIAEKIFAPLQAALLALAIRRKFMR